MCSYFKVEFSCFLYFKNTNNLFYVKSQVLRTIVFLDVDEDLGLMVFGKTNKSFIFISLIEKSFYKIINSCEGNILITKFM